MRKSSKFSTFSFISFCFRFPLVLVRISIPRSRYRPMDCDVIALVTWMRRLTLDFFFSSLCLYVYFFFPCVFFSIRLSFCIFLSICLSLYLSIISTPTPLSTYLTIYLFLLIYLSRHTHNSHTFNLTKLASILFSFHFMII